MITLNLNGLEEQASKNNHLLEKYWNNINSKDLGFLNLPSNTEVADAVVEFANANSSKFEHFVILGIGGSALGPICIKEALTHLFKPSKLTILDNIDPALLSEFEETINHSKTLFIVITKSGGTPETLSQYFYFREKAPKENFVFITDPEKGLLREIATQENIPTFEIPENVGGRFSVLTAVGLLPAALLNLNPHKLLSGAKQALENKELAFQLASLQYELYKNGKIINVMMPYSQHLVRLADWYRQLLAESIGKTPEIGITPINALGATDQHSQLQLYNDGPKDKFFLFLEVTNLGPQIQIPQNPISYLKDVSFNKLIATEKHATEQSLTQNGHPNITLKLEEINEETLGAMFMHLELSIAFLGEFFNINAFDQPGVELSKNLTKQMLQ